MLPNHILVIPDGNRRFAKKKGITLEKAYELASRKTTTLLIDYFVVSQNVHELSFFALSFDNVKKRTEQELMPIYVAHEKTYADWLANKDFMKKIKFEFVGAKELLPGFYRAKIKELEEKTASNEFKVNILVAYDGQLEIVEAIKRANNLMDRSNIMNALQLKDSIDAIIRTGNERRLSNCPLYQSSYAELIFVPFYYPEFTKQKAKKVLDEYSSRKRRFGK